MKQLPRIRCRGKAFEVGRTHGQFLRDQVRFNLANFWYACAASGLSQSDVIGAAKRLAQDYRDSTIEEIRGIAFGSGSDADEMLALNLCHGVVLADECTVLFAMGDATASGQPLFLKNSDKIGSANMEGANFYQHKEINVVLAIHPPDGPATIGVSSAGSTGLKMGVSDLGVVVGTNIARSRELAERRVDTAQLRALDRVQLAREGLTCETAMSAAASIVPRLAQTPNATPGNIEFVDSGLGVILEGSYDRVALHVVRGGIASRANSFLVLRELNDPEDLSSCSRFARTQQLLSERVGKLTPEDMKRFSQDHANGPGPNSICRHGTHYEEETSQSAMVVQLERERPRQTRFWIALGKPCHAWRSSEANFEGTMESLDQLPAGFLNGDTWKRFSSEIPVEQ